MPTNYKISFDNYYGNLCEVLLIEDYEDDVFVELLGSDSPVEVTYDSEDETIFSTMITSKAKIRVLVDSNNIDFIERMAVLKEGEYQVEINWAGSGRWVGALIPDEQSRTFSIVQGELELTAVDRLIQMKGKKLIDSDGAYMSGEHTLRQYIDRCFAQVLPPGAPGLDTMVIYSNLVLSNDTTYSFPNIMEQLSVYAEAFNDDLGRPINCYEVVKAIASSLNMRCFYVGNFLFFVDIINYIEFPPFGLDPVTVGFKGDTVGATLIKNSENITTVPTFTESVCRFKYKGLVGLLVDGYLQNWIASGSGFVLEDWTYSPRLLSQPDYESRRRGNGRQENPFGIFLKCDALGFLDFDEIGGSSLNEVYPLDTINISAKLKFNDMNQIVPTRIGGNEFDIFGSFRAVIYNNNNPDLSACILTEDGGGSGKYAWYWVDLTGSGFASGVFDFEALIDAVETAYGFGPYATQNIIQFSNTSSDQTISIDLPSALLIGRTGKLFVAFGGACCTDLDNDTYPPVDIILQNVIVTKSVPKTDNKEVKGEVVYVSRFGNMSVEKVEKEISLNTSANWNVSGALRTPITYTLTQDSLLPDGTIIPSGTTIPAGPVYRLSRTGTTIFNNQPLVAYNAMSRMLFDYNQYKIDYEVKGNYININAPIDLSSLYDVSRPSTEIYNSISLQIRNSINIKKSENKITSVTMKFDQRSFSGNTLDEFHDLVESYYIT